MQTPYGKSWLNLGFLLNILRELGEGITGQALHQGTASPAFPVRTGVKQNYVLAPILSSLYLVALQHTLPEVNVSERSVGNIFNIVQLDANTKYHLILIGGFQYVHFHYYHYLYCDYYRHYHDHDHHHYHYYFIINSCCYYHYNYYY